MAIKIRKGSSHNIVVQFEQKIVKYVAITGVTSAAPVRITAADHGMPDGWRCAISNVKGGPASLINAKHNPPRDKEYFIGKVIDSDTIELNSVNGNGYAAYTSGGILQYNLPVDLPSPTALLHVREKEDSPLHLIEKTEADITIDNGTATITFDPADTADLEPECNKAICDMVITAGGFTHHMPRQEIQFVDAIAHVE